MAYMCADGFYYGVVFNNGLAYFLKFVDANAARIVTEKMAKVSSMAGVVLGQREYNYLSSLMPYYYADELGATPVIRTGCKAEAKAFGNAMALCHQITTAYAVTWPVTLNSDEGKINSELLLKFIDFIK